MTTTTCSAALIPVAAVSTNTERLALAGFLAGYSGLTREAYELDLRQYASWCHQQLLALNGLRVSEATGANVEALGIERGHRTLVITRKGGKVVTIPLAPPRRGR